MIDHAATGAQNAAPRLATRLALLVTLIASFGAVYQAGMVPSSVVVGLIALVIGAQLLGHPAVLGSVITKLPTTAIALGIVLLAVYVTMQLGFVAGGIVWCAALFMLCIDWNTLARLPLPLLLSLLLVTVSMTRGRLDGVIPVLVVWTAGLVATLVLMERDASGAGRRLRVHEEVARRRHGNPGVEIGVVALLLLVLVPLLALLIPDPTTGRPNRLGDIFSDQKQATPYWGFEDRLDTSVRGKLDDEIVMRVKADAPDYWRGTTFDEWDGRTWTKSAGAAQNYPGFGTVTVRPSLGDGRGGTPFKQVFTVEKAGSDLVFGAYRTAEVEMAEPATVDRSDGTVRALAPMAPGSVYTAISRRKDVTADSLRRDDPTAQAIPRDIATRYLALPDHVPERVRQLGHDITASAATTYDKVRAIETWMRDNTEYSLDIPPLPAGADAVEQHLFVDKRGFCEQIATSSTVLLRSQGIPARLATGFVSGDRNPLTGEFTVRARDAHAWVEVWFPATGWQAFDPTANVPLSGEYQRSAWDDLTSILRALLPFAVALLVVAGLVVGGYLIGKRIRAARARQRQPWAAQLTQRLLRAGHDRDRPRQPHESLVEYTAALADDVLPDERVGAVGALVSRALFSEHEPTAEQQAWVTTVLDEVERANPPGKVRKQRRHQARDERRRVRDEAKAAATAARDARDAARDAAAPPSDRVP